MVADLRALFADWIKSGKENFRVRPRSWVRSTLLNIWAVFYLFIVKLPAHVIRLLKHITAFFTGIWRWLFVDGIRLLTGKWVEQENGGDEKKERGAKPRPKPDSNAQEWAKRGGLGSLAWIGRLLSKTLDALMIPEILNLLMHIVKFNSRPLTETEIIEAKKVFGDSLRYWRIRLDEWSFLAHVGNYIYKKRNEKPKSHDGESQEDPKKGEVIKETHMAMTLFSTIHLTRKINSDRSQSDMEWLIHELTHAAQMEHAGSQIIVEAIIAQGREGYKYGGPEGLAGRMLAEFNREQQGDIIRDYYKAIMGKKPFVDFWDDYERMGIDLRAGKL